MENTCVKFFFVKLQVYTLQPYKEIPTQVFSAKFWKAFQNTFLIENLLNFDHGKLIWHYAY